MLDSHLGIAPVQRTRSLKRRWRSGFSMILVCAALTFLSACAFPRQPPIHTVAGSGNAVHGGLICATAEEVGVHYHTHLTLVLNGKRQVLPQNIGISSHQECMYWLHTHATDGVIHVEAPDTNRWYSLGDFFAIWQKTQADAPTFGPPRITETSFFGNPIDSQHPLTIYVAGTLATDDPNAIELRAHRDIWLEYGAPLITPTAYQFQNGE